MSGIMVETSEYHGSLVAFEGPEDTISTQLRLLPKSPKILILPPLQQVVEEPDASSPFDARLHILKTHEACDARTEIALKFLRESKPDNKRLVFMNGGTASAQMSCISAICKHETNGNYIRAEALFNELIQNGIAGLRQRDGSQRGAENISKPEAIINIHGQDDEVPDDPISKAMRAADALDLETAFLQDTDELDLAIAARPRSISVPIISMVDDRNNATPSYVFNSTDISQKASLPRSTAHGELLDIEKWRATTTNEDELGDPSLVYRSSSVMSEVHPYDRLRPTSAVGPSRAIAESIPSSPALLGEAFLVDLRPPVLQNQHLKSVDRIYATAIRNQDISICNLPPPTVAKPEVPASAQSTGQEEYDSPKWPTLRSNFYRETPLSAVVKPTRTIARRRSPPQLNITAEELMQPMSHVSRNSGPDENFAHQATQTELALDVPGLGSGNDNSSLYSGDDQALDTNEPFQTVLPMVEDVVIHIRGEDCDQNLAAMVQAFKNGTYPLPMPPLLLEARGDMDQLGTPTTMGSAPKLDEADIGDSQQNVRETIPIYNPDEYDPFASHGNYVGPPPSYLSKDDIGSQPQDTAVISAQPLLAETPPPKTTTVLDTTFHDLDIRDCKTAVCIQNSLRSVLNVYFPSENIGYHQFNFPLLPELSSFWRPVFRDIPSGDSEPTRKIDLILAIGAQKDVDRGLLGTVSGSLEKLGMEPNGASRSGRLNLRYLIATTMQAFTSQPLTNQTQDNPFTNPLLLATLIVPHLETYIAAHSAIRFLILEYPGEYLSTVLALQHLIGVDLLKVAGIIDAEASSPNSYMAFKKPGFYTAAPPTADSPGKGTSAIILSPKVYKPKSETTEKRQTPQLSFSKANFILTSTATETEIATMISTIWRILIDISPSYIPGDVAGSNWKQSPYNNNRHPPSPISYLKKTDAPFLRAAAILGFTAPPEDERQQAQPPLWDSRANYVSTGTYADLPVATQRPATPARSSRASVAETFRGSPTPRTPRTPRISQTQAQHRKLRHLLGHDPATFPVTVTGGVATSDAASFYDIEDEDDHGQFSAEERKYMPLWSHDGGPRRGSSYKALKWLGLSI
ncbi:hypothetical protein F5Y14DRAFT_353962 [Nemania sp. NC0429]|nr:hypothetical protein F5Y14DRAFT_353962 [Nemania sp. NC0429]